MQVKYTSAITQIKAWVVSNKLKAGNPLPTASHLGLLLKISHSTINRACLMLVGEGYFRREGYKLYLAHDPQQSDLSSKPVWVISPFDYFNATVMEFYRRAGVPCISRIAGFENPNTGYLAMQEAFAYGCAGVIYASTEWNRQMENLLNTRKHTPVVVCTPIVGRGEHHYITTDHHSGIRCALEHLVDQGHREIAFITDITHRSFANTELAVLHEAGKYNYRVALLEAYREVCTSMGLIASSKRIWGFESLGKVPNPDAIKSFDDHRKNNPQVTALFGDDRGVRIAFEATPIPDNLSVVGYFNLDEGQYFTPPLTTVGFSDPHLEPRLCATELLALLQQSVKRTYNLTYTQILIKPQLIQRKSTRRIVKESTPLDNAHKERPDKQLNSPSDSWSNSYPSLRKSANQNWIPLNLAPLANRQRSHQNSWPANNPLLHLDGGTQWIHGVPFSVIKKSENHGRDIVVMASKHAHEAEGVAIPSSMQLPVNQKARAVYFLHACTYSQATEFAAYELVYSTGQTERIPLLALSNGIQNRDDLLRANIQDWWYTFEQRDFPHAHHLLVTDQAHPQSYVRYLYTLEWINPHPNRKIKTIRIVSDPKEETTLVVFAITVCE